jgi:adenine phosphoribosyltransferase
MLEKLKTSLQNCQVVKLGDYSYFIHPLSNGIPSIDPSLLEEVVEEVVKHSKLNCTKIVTVEAMGIPFATALALKTRLPYTIIRKRQLNLPQEISVEQVTGYSKSKLFVNGIERRDRIMFVDDVLSTGSTLRASLKAFSQIGAGVSEVWIIFNRGDAAPKIKKEFGIKVHSLLYVKVLGDKVVAEQKHGS